MPERFHALISDFCFGETSPRVKSRLGGGNIFGVSPAEVYRSGCRDVTNMVIVPQGGAYRREGLKFGRDTVQDVGAKAGENFRLFTLKGESADLSLLLVPGLLMLYQLPAYGVLGTAVTPYTASDLLNISVTQFEQKVVIASTAHRPRQLTVTPFAFTDPMTAGFIAPLYAFQDAKSPLPQLSSWRLRVTFAAGFAAQYMGILISGRIISNSRGRQVYAAMQTNTAASQASLMAVLSLDITYCYEPVVTYIGTGTVGTSTWFDYDISYKYQTKYGDGSGQLQVVSLASEQMQAVASPSTVNPASDLEPLWSGPFLLLHGGHYWQCMTSHIGIANTEPGVGANAGAYWIDRGTTVPANGIDYDVQTTPDWLVDQAWSPRNRGWPGHMTFHEQRLGGTGPPEALSVIAATKLGGNNDMFNFTLGVNDGDGMLFRLTGVDNAVIHWLKSMDKLYIGTSAGVFVQAASPWTPTNVQFARINGFRCDQQIHPVEVEGELFFPTIGGRQIRQVSFSNDLQAWQSFDLTAFAEHLFTDTLRVKQLASHEGVASIMWAVRTDGALLGLTYSPAYNALAWHKHSVADPVLQVAPAFDGQKYVAVVLVNRLTYVDQLWSFHPMLETLEHTSQNLFQSEPTLFTEGATPHDWQLVVNQPKDWSIHMDSWEQIPYNLFQQIAGTKAEKEPPVRFLITLPPRMALRRVGVVDNGVYMGSYVANILGQVVVVGVPLGPLIVGFEFPARIEPNRLESKAVMTSQSMKVRWVKPVLRLLTSALPLVNGFRPNERSQDDVYDEATGLFTGDVYMVSFGSDGRLVIEPDLPLPCQLSGIFGLVNVEEG